VGNISLGKTTMIDSSMMVGQNKSMVAVVTYDPVIVSVALRFLVRNKDCFPLASVVSDRYPLDKINDAFQQAKWDGKQTSGSRAVITP
jgi:Zn-dependent alcohol dehydrogenase